MEFFSQNFHFLHSRTDFNFNLTIFSPNFSWVKNKSKQNTITKFSFEKTKIKQSKPIPSIWISLPKIKKTRIHEYLIHWYCLLSLFISILLLYYYITDHLLYSSFIFILFLCHFECNTFIFECIHSLQHFPNQNLKMANKMSTNKIK